MKTVHICIFEDVRFAADWDVAQALKCDTGRRREERGWAFCLHDTFCPENESKNANALAMDSVEAYGKAINYVCDDLRGYGCLFFDCEFFSGDGENLELTREQVEEVSGFVSGKIKEFAFPGLFLALRAAKNPNWSGVIAIASAAANQAEYKKFAEKLQAICTNKRVLPLEHALTDFTHADEMGKMCEIAIEQFLQLVGARSSPKDRLFPAETEFWFNNDFEHEKGYPPHTWRVFDNLPPESPARKSFNGYFVRLFGCTEAEAAKWIQRTHQANLYSQLKHSVGACAKAHGACHTIRGPTLFTVLLAVSACCPNPMSWVKKINARVTADIFHYDCSPNDAKRLFDELIKDGGLFQRLFVWDQENCPSRSKSEPVIVDVQIASDLLKIQLDSEFSVSKLISRNGKTKECLNATNEALRKDKHPLLITLDGTTNAVIFETKERA